MLVTVSVVGVAAYSLFSALNSGGPPKVPQIVFGLLSVVLGWLAVHTMAGLHYAYEYYEAPEPVAARGAKEQGGMAGGLDWPEGYEPDGIAFLYLSVQIAAALQISDTPTTTNKMRALILAHTVFSFFCNTMLVAAAVNVVVTAGTG